MRPAKGFSLIELLMALMVFGVVGASITTLVLSSHRVFRRQMTRADLDALLRQVTALVQAELRGLDSGDSTGSDLEILQSDRVVYKPVRTLRFLCRPADTVEGTVTTWAAHHGVRDLRPDLDSVLIMSTSYSSEHWETGDLLGMEPGVCPGDRPGYLVRVGGIAKDRLAAIAAGAPLLGRETVELRAYPDGRRTWWVGMRRYQKREGRWPSIQPVVGPISAGGFELNYYRQDGGLVTDHTDVAGIRVRISLLIADPSARWEDQETTIEVALRGRGNR